MKKIDTPFKIKGLELTNRIVMAPMCQYSVTKEDGVPNNWHFVHYVSRTVGGTGLIIMEMTGVTPEGRITDQDLGIRDDSHVPAYREIVDEVHRQGAKIGIQIAHAGRKAEDANSSPSLPVGERYEEFESIHRVNKKADICPLFALDQNSDLKKSTIALKKSETAFLNDSHAPDSWISLPSSCAESFASWNPSLEVISSIRFLELSSRR